MGITAVLVEFTYAVDAEEKKRGEGCFGEMGAYAQAVRIIFAPFCPPLPPLSLLFHFELGSLAAFLEPKKKKNWKAKIGWFHSMASSRRRTRQGCW